MATIYTIGHGARRAEAMISMLRAARIGTLVDVRAWPVSRRHPQFSKDRLKASLEQAGIRYEWHGKALGGMRRSYADHMQTDEFATAAAALAQLPGRVCIVCAESDPAECHRSHIADWLVARGNRVIHLLDPDREREHPARLL